MTSLQTILSEATFETYFVQVVIKMKDDFNFTEIYNQIRGIKDVIVVKVVDNDKLGIYKKKNETSYSSNIYDKEGYLLDKAGLDALLHNYVLQMKKGIRERTSKK